MIILGIPTLNRYDDCVKAVQSAYNGIVKPDRTIIVDNGGTFDTHFDQLPDEQIDVASFDGKNIGCSAAWNFIIRQMTDEDVCIIANDDVVFQFDTIDALYRAYLENSSHLIYVTAGAGLNAFSLFLYTPKARKIVGYFDENFYPAYHEDNCCAYRMKIVGYDLVSVPCSPIEHIGSATIRSYTSEQMQQHHNQFRRNQQYYIEKYGGLPGQEQFLDRFGQLTKKLLYDVAKGELTPLQALARLKGDT
jgi:GT2 family glycosyltransferase